LSVTVVADAESLYAAHRQGVFRYLCRAVGHADTARDLTQDVFLRIARTAVPRDSEGGVRAWVFRIARNLAIDHQRARRRTPGASNVHDVVVASAPAQDVSAAVNEALATLGDVDRDVFLLREVAGLGYDDIARACGLTPDAVRSRIHRTRLELRARLAAPIARQTARPMRLRTHESE